MRRAGLTPLQQPAHLLKLGRGEEGGALLVDQLTATLAAAASLRRRTPAARPPAPATATAPAAGATARIGAPAPPAAVLLVVV